MQNLSYLTLITSNLHKIHLRSHYLKLGTHKLKVKTREMKDNEIPEKTEKIS